MMYSRPLRPGDGPQYGALRTMALATEEDKFLSTLEAEQNFDEAIWVETVTPTDEKSYFGRFDEFKLIGALMAKRLRGDPSGKTAYWGAAYVLPPYRGDGNSKSMYIDRVAWTIDHKFTSAVFAIKEDNDVCKRIHKRHGARMTHREIMNFPGRPNEIWNWYKVDLAEQPQKKIIMLPNLVIAPIEAKLRLTPREANRKLKQSAILRA